MARRAPSLFGACFLSAAMLFSGIVNAAEPIKLGLVGPLTGPAANTGLTVRATWDLVAKRINAEGGLEIDGVKRPVELIVADSQSKPNIGVGAAQKLLTRDRVDVLVGDLLHSDVALALMELAPAYPDKVLYIPLPVSSTISERIASSHEKYGNVWKWDGDSEAYGVSLADHLTKLGESGKRNYPNKTYAIVSELTDFSDAIQKSVQGELKASGWKQVAHESVPIGNTDFYSQLSKLKALNPDVIISIFTAASSGLSFVKQFNEQGTKSENIAVYYAGLPAFRNGIGKDGNGLVFFGGAFDPRRSDRGKPFAKLLSENNINVSGDAALGYCSANVLFGAIQRAKSLKVQDLNRELLATDDDTCPDYRRIVFDPKRHSPKLGPDYFFMTAGQMFDDGKDFYVFYPPKAATGKLDELAAPGSK